MIFTAANDAPAMPPNPNTAAINPIIRNVTTLALLYPLLIDQGGATSGASGSSKAFLDAKMEFKK